MPAPFVSKRAPIYADVPNEKWNDWRWQLSHRLNTAEEIEKVIPLTDSERKAQQTQGLFRVDVTPYFISLIDPNDPNDPTRLQIIPRAEEMQAFTAMMEDSLAEDRHSPVPGLVHRYSDRISCWSRLSAVSEGNLLLRFDSGDPSATLSSLPIAGTQGGETVVAIDVRPADGLLYGNPAQVWVQLKAAGITVLWSAVATWGLLKAVDAVMGLRVSDHERAGRPRPDGPPRVGLHRPGLGAGPLMRRFSVPAALPDASPVQRRGASLRASFRAGLPGRKTALPISPAGVDGGQEES